MSKRRGATPCNVAAWIKRGDGQGFGYTYKPFFHVRDERAFLNGVWDSRPAGYITICPT